MVLWLTMRGLAFSWKSQVLALSRQHSFRRESSDLTQQGSNNGKESAYKHVCCVFHCCEKITAISKLKGRKFILAYGLRGSSPWSASSIAVAWHEQKRYGGRARWRKLLHSRQPGSRERESQREEGLRGASPFQGLASVTCFFQVGPIQLWTHPLMVSTLGSQSPL